MVPNRFVLIRLVFWRPLAPLQLLNTNGKNKTLQKQADNKRGLYDFYAFAGWELLLDKTRQLDVGIVLC